MNRGAQLPISLHLRIYSLRDSKLPGGPTGTYLSFFSISNFFSYRNLPAERVNNALSDAEDIIGIGVWAFLEMADHKIERLEYARSARSVAAPPSLYFLSSANTLL